MRKTAQQLKTEIPLLLEGIEGPSQDITKDCYCVPFWWHQGCTSTYYDPAFEAIAQMYKEELDNMSRQLLGFTGPCNVSDFSDEPGLKIWAITFRTVLPTIAILEAHITAKGFIYSYCNARHIPQSEQTRLLVLADQILMVKMMGISWEEGLENSFLSVHSVVSEGILSTEFAQFIHTVREMAEDPKGDFDEERLVKVHDAASAVFHSIETIDKASTTAGSKEMAVKFLKATTTDILNKIKDAIGHDEFEELEKNIGRTFDDFLDSEEDS